ncbi:MAG: nucleotide exchange factor GrpE [Lachnospiraceae bacterium]|nr:nucleotide exchange factor GrpE [Lachnospiraceae bacterium]
MYSEEEIKEKEDRTTDEAAAAEETQEAAESPETADGCAQEAGSEECDAADDASGDASDGASGEEDDGKEKSGKDGFFGRRHKKELAKKEEELAALKDRYMRTLAEYENYRRRTDKEKADIYAYAVKDVMTKILPVLDNLERGIALIPEESAKDPLAEGMDKIHKQFEKALEDIGVKPIEAVGKEFDPNFHNAVMHVEDESLGANTVAGELQKGYTYRDMVVRHSMVQVAN